MKPFPIPVMSESPFPAEEAEPLEYLGHPGDMAVFRMPLRRSHTTTPEDERAAGAVIEALLAAMRAHRFGEAGYPRLDLRELPSACLQALHETLGEGEVSARIEGDPLIEAQETAFAGVWRVRVHSAGPHQPSQDTLEACAIPDAIRHGARGKTRLDFPPEPPGLMNAPVLIREIAAHAAAYQAEGKTQVINLSLLPVTPQDLEYLDTALGRSGVSLLSRGYGNCRITATALDGVWWVQYFNSSDTLLLNTLEVVAMPEAALAAAEDLADSIERLEECLVSLRES
jgi:hydrogenase-1 operon protein HyaF